MDHQDRHHDHEEHDFQRRIERKIDALLKLGVIMSNASDQVIAALNDLDSKTNTLADQQAQENTISADLGTKIDALIAGGAASGLTPEATALLQAVSDHLDARVQTGAALVTTLQGIAAKGSPVVVAASAKR